MKEEQYYKLINRFLAGEASEKEGQQLDDWLNAAPENQKLFDEIEKIWQGAEAQQPDSKMSFEQFWQIIDSKLGISASESNARILSMDKPKFDSLKRTFWQQPSRWMAAAAVLIVILGAAILFQLSEPGQMIHTTQNAEQKEINLPDGSIVRLNAASEIRFTENFTESERFIDLKGQAFFDVQRDGRPFIVQTQNAQIQVLGTSFDVWARDASTKVIVKEGSVKFLSREASEETAITLTANESSVCDGNLPPENPRKVDAQQVIGWLENRMVFSQTAMKEVVAELVRSFDAVIEMSNPEIRNLTLTGAFQDQTMDEILSSICLTLNLTFERRGNIYYISQ